MLTSDKRHHETRKPDHDPPVHEDDTLRADVKRKREELNNSTIGGF